MNPRAEWREDFPGCIPGCERDFFYDPNMHGVNWEAHAASDTAKCSRDAVTRWDVDFLIGEFTGELNASHTYHGGGDMEQAAAAMGRHRGVDWELSNGAYRVKRIIRGGPWDSVFRSPLDETGIEVRKANTCWRSTASRSIKVGSVCVVPRDSATKRWYHRQLVAVDIRCPPGRSQMSDERNELRFGSWIEERRQMVDKATNGKIGYIYVQSTGVDAQNELVRRFMAQWKKDDIDHRRAVEQRR